MSYDTVVVYIKSVGQLAQNGHVAAWDECMTTGELREVVVVVPVERGHLHRGGKERGEEGVREGEERREGGKREGGKVEEWRERERERERAGDIVTQDKAIQFILNFTLSKVAPQANSKLL